MQVKVVEGLRVLKCINDALVRRSFSRSRRGGEDDGESLSTDVRNNLLICGS